MKLNRQLSLMIERNQVHEQQPCVKRARTAAIITLPDPQQAGQIVTDYAAATSSIESENRQKKKNINEKLMRNLSMLPHNSVITLQSVIVNDKATYELRLQHYTCVI